MKLSNTDIVTLNALHAKGNPAIQRFWLNKFGEALAEDMRDAWSAGQKQSSTQPHE